MTDDDRPVLLFDLDGTVLDSAPGIIAAQRAAMVDVGLEPAAESVLRSDLGPPPSVLLARVGVPAERIDEAVTAYRRHYHDEGISNASVYPGIRELLVDLQPRFRLATATMKLISTAVPFLDHHRLRDHFEVVGGAERSGEGDKSAIIRATRLALGDPDPRRMIMIGDRHSDITGGRAQGMRTVAVTWGYGSRRELEDSGPDVIIDHPGQLTATLPDLLKVLPNVDLIERPTGNC